MINIPRIVSKQASSFWSDANLYQIKSPVFLPFYHVVSNATLPHILNYPYPNEKQFEADLDYLLKYFHAISLDDFYANPNTSKNVFHLSFDDGLCQCAEVIAPILLRKGIPATFFINSGFIDNKTLSHRHKASLILHALNTLPDAEAEALLNKNNLDETNLLDANFKQRHILNDAADLLELDFSAFLKTEKPYLSTAQVLYLHKEGFSIGGHSHKHPEFWKISEKKQLKHIRKNMQWINTTVQPNIKAFAFPFSDKGVAPQVFQKIRDENMCDITFGKAGVIHDKLPAHFQRYPAEQTGIFSENLKSEFIYYILRKAFGKVSVQH